MSITTLEEAFDIIDNSREGLPKEAIQYLYDHPKDQRILDKIIFNLENAYNVDLFYDSEKDNFIEAPLWYAVVAENHLDESLIIPIVHLFTSATESWGDILEQGAYLVCQMSKKLGDKAIEVFVDAMKTFHKEDREVPYYYLFDCLYYCDKQKYEDDVYGLLAKPDANGLALMAGKVPYFNSEKLNVRLNELLRHFESLETITLTEKLSISTIKYTLKLIENLKKNAETLSPPFYDTREPWQEYFQFFKEPGVSAPQKKIKTVMKEKLGRNDLCICGSGKKYKKCCL